jgi:predicted DCC family thiol-disulfide oxidoreductase YuxK
MSTQVGLPILIFDGDCAFCTSSVRFLARWVVRSGAIQVAPWQSTDLDAVGLTVDQCAAALQWVAKSGQVFSGHAAIGAVLRAGHPVWRPVGVLLMAPGFSWLAARLYSWVAAHRYHLPGGTPACRLNGPS